MSFLLTLFSPIINFSKRTYGIEINPFDIDIQVDLSDNVIEIEYNDEVIFEEPLPTSEEIKEYKEEIYDFTCGLFSFCSKKEIEPKVVPFQDEPIQKIEKNKKK